MPDPIILPSLIALKDELMDVYKASRDEIKYLLDDGLQKYALNQRNRFEKTKTFYFRNDLVDFYGIYYPLTVETRGVTKKSSYKCDDNIPSLFREYSCITLIGTAGSGKSMLMKHLFLCFLKNDVHIPVYLELRRLNSFDGDFPSFINHIIFNNELSPNDTILERLLTGGKFLFILDGYDEIKSDILSKTLNQIDDFINKYSHNYYVLTSRPGVNVESLPRFQNFFINNLIKQDVEPFIRKQIALTDKDESFVETIMKVLSDPKNNDYLKYVQNPLLLTMFIYTFDNYPELPDKKSDFYSNVFDTLSTRHDNVSKRGELHERKTGLKTADFKQVLEWFSFFSYFDEKYSFDKNYLVSTLEKVIKECNIDCEINDLIDDLVVSLSILILDGLIYTFPHRSMQEYFLAKFISSKSEQFRDKIYKDKIIVYSSINNDFNLWYLLEELDIRFKENLLAVYKEIYSKLTVNEEICRIENYYKLLNCSFGIRNKNKNLENIISRDIVYILEMPSPIRILGYKTDKEFIFTNQECAVITCDNFFAMNNKILNIVVNEVKRVIKIDKEFIPQLSHLLKINELLTFLDEIYIIMNKIITALEEEISLEKKEDDILRYLKL